jgi:drug/metabolite transporter (DMT)-like permease
MSLAVLLAVLGGALLHASWNVVVKRDADKRLATAAVFLGAGIAGLLVVPFVPALPRAAWPYLGAGVVAECVYGLLLAAAYRQGDFSHAYPLMRGTAPLVVALGSPILIGEPLGVRTWLGVGLVSAGILSLIGTAGGRRSWPATRIALANSVVIAAYTLVDGVGARLSGGHPFGYTAWLFLLTALPWCAWLVHLAREQGVRSLARRLRRGLGGGACSAGSYGIALWAMTHAPVAAVAALRETSIVFGMVLGAVVLHERVTAGRLVAAIVIVCGVVAMRLA